MRKFSRVGIIGGSVLIIALAVSVAVTYADGGTWNSSLQVQNLGTGPANIQVEYYDQSGVVQATQLFTDVQPGAMINVYQGSVTNLPDGFIGSAVVSSNEPIGGLGSLSANYGATGGYAYYSGVSEGSNIAYAPTVLKQFGGGGWNTEMAVQNTGAGPATLTVEYYDSAGSLVSAATESQVIEDGASYLLKQVDNANLPTGFIGSAKITGGGGATSAVVVNSISGTRLESANAFPGGDTVAYLPVVMNYFGGNQWVSSFQVMNLGSSQTTVDIYYYAGSATPVKTVLDVPIPAFSSINRYQPSVDADLGTGFLGSVKVVSDSEPIVAVGSTVTTAGGKSYATQYNGFSSGSTEVYLPTIMVNWGGNQWLTSFQVMNVGSSDADVTIEYYEPGNPTPVKTLEYDGVENPMITPMANINRYQPTVDADLGTGFMGSVIVTSNNGQPVVAIGSVLSPVVAGDSAEYYNGLPGS
ncbi:MAG: hypothetical protein MUP04_05610 [Anaerolineae bacterium]|nr:hypothetical protein [Anaerolineae bacterium]